MTSSPGRTLASALATRAERQCAAAAAWTLLVVLLVVVLMLLARRLGGALVLPLGGTGLLTVALLGGMAAAVVRWVCTPLARERPVRIAGGQLALFALPGIAAILLLAAVTLPGSGIVGLVMSWFLLVLAEAGTWLLALHRRRGLIAPPPSEPTAADAELPPNLLQQVTRLLDESGGESLHAVLRALVPAGDRQAVVHAAFCPPLAAAPRLAAHALDCDADVRVTQAESFGARLEVRLPAAAAADQPVLVELIGSVTAARSA